MSKAEIEKKEIVQQFKQFIRIRPFTEAEKNVNKKSEKPEISSLRSSVEHKDGKILIMDPKCLTLPKPMAKDSHKKSFPEHSGVMWSFGQDPWVAEQREKTKLEEDDAEHEFYDQDKVYDSVKSNVVAQVFEGFNQSIAVYGGINSGKTYTMFGTDSARGIAPRFIDDLVAAIPAEHEARKAPGEDLSITVSAQCFRIYQEEIEDVLAGPHLVKEYATVKYTEAEKATSWDITDAEGREKLAQRVWGHKESVRRPSTISTPNKHNRCSVVLKLTVKQASKFEGGGEESVENEKSASLCLVDVGFGPKAENESTTDYKKINTAQTAFAQVLRQMGQAAIDQKAAEEEDKRRGNSGNVKVKKAHISFNSSNLTRMLEHPFGQSHCQLILNISPHHKSHTETQQMMDWAHYGAAIMGRAVQVQSKELGEFREKLEQKFETEVALQEEKKAHEIVSEALEVRLHEIRQLEDDLKGREKKEQDLKDDIATMEAKIQQLNVRIESLREARRRLFASLDARHAKAKDGLAEAQRRQAEIDGLITDGNAELKIKKQKVDEAMALIQRAAGLRSLLTGEPMEKDEGLRKITDEDMNGQTLEDPSVFRGQAESAISNLSEAVAKFEKVANMNEENTILLKQLGEAMQQEQEADDKLTEAEEAIKRRKRKCLREIVDSVEAVQRGPLERLMKIVNENANASNRVGTAEFYDEEANGICRVLGSNLDEDEQSIVPPGWCQYSAISPVRTWVLALRPEKGGGGGDLGASVNSLDTGSNDGTRKASAVVDDRFKVSDVTNEEIDSIKSLIRETEDWNYALLNFHQTRRAIEQAYDNWFAKMPDFSMAKKIVKVMNEEAVIAAQVKTLQDEIAQLLIEIEQEEKKKDGEQARVQKLRKQIEQKKLELKKAQDKCVIL